MISPSDWVLIGCTITLAIVALTAPYLNDLWKRKSLAPKLKIVFHKESPYIVEPDEHIYLICFEVKNEGNSKAKNCEVIIEEFYYKNEEGNSIEDNKNFPAKLGWVTHSRYSPIDILPKAGNFFNIFYIYKCDEPKYPDKLKLEIYTEPVVRFASSLLRVPLNYLKIKIVIYSENAEKCEQYIEIKSPGIMRENKEQILQEMKITLS